MRKIFLVALLMLPMPAWALDRSHKAWDALLRKHVVLIDGGKASQMNYAAIAAERAALREYLQDLSRVSEAQFNG